MKNAALISMIVMLLTSHLSLQGQNVGIGTENPQAKLEIYNPVKSMIKIRSSTYSDTTGLILSNKYPSGTGTDFVIASNQEEGLNFSSNSDIPGFNSVDILHLSPDGKIGIGTATPLAKLTIVPEFAGPDILHVQDADSIDILSVKSNRHVGIGTINPQEKLEVNGKIKLGNDATTSEAGTIRWNSSTSDFEGFNGTGWLSLTGSNISWPPSGQGEGQISGYQQAISSDANQYENFGISVSISGNYAIVGAQLAQVGGLFTGAAFVFFKNGSEWIQQAKLVASDGLSGDDFGTSVAISGDYAIVGAPFDDDGANSNEGSCYIFVRNGTNWSQQAKLTASDGGALDQFGWSVSISGDYCLVGSRYRDIPNATQGGAYVFVRSGTSWTQQATLVASDGATNDQFGTSVSIRGSSAIIGAPVQGGFNTGSAYIFTRTGSTWSQQAILTAAVSSANDNFGISVDIENDYCVVGAYHDDVNSMIDQGSAFIFFRTGSVWSQQAYLYVPNGSSEDDFGSSVAISGEFVIISAPQEATSSDCSPEIITGAAYVFKKINAVWSLYSHVTDPVIYPYGNFGASVSISGGAFIIGSPSANPNGNAGQGKGLFGKVD